MKLPRIDYLEPKTVQEACALLAKGDALPVAGGTDLVPSLKHRVKAPTAVVNLKAIRDLNYITYKEGEGLKIGALATLRDLQGNAGGAGNPACQALLWGWQEAHCFSSR